MLRMTAPILALTALIAGPALAQSPDPAPTQTPQADQSQKPSLSDKLDASGGVIKPKEVDPAIEKPAPRTGAGEVIKPSPDAPQSK